MLHTSDTVWERGGGMALWGQGCEEEWETPFLQHHWIVLGLFCIVKMTFDREKMESGTWLLPVRGQHNSHVAALKAGPSPRRFGSFSCCPLWELLWMEQGIPAGSRAKALLLLRNDLPAVLRKPLSGCLCTFSATHPSSISSEVHFLISPPYLS